MSAVLSHTACGRSLATRPQHAQEPGPPSDMWGAPRARRCVSAFRGLAPRCEVDTAMTSVLQARSSLKCRGAWRPAPGFPAAERSGRAAWFRGPRPEPSPRTRRFGPFLGNSGNMSCPSTWSLGPRAGPSACAELLGTQNLCPPLLFKTKAQMSKPCRDQPGFPHGSCSKPVPGSEKAAFRWTDGVLPGTEPADTRHLGLLPARCLSPQL